jgi:hypothetical protein
MCETVGQLGRIDPAACRAHAAAHFGIEQMTEGYLRIYHRLLDKPHERSSIEAGVEPRPDHDARSLALPA